jgi:energy-coupling factor transporter ATP-binding protein EcfA2
VSDDHLWFESIGVHRMPGIKRGDGFTTDGLRPGINVVIGPNGSGKTTLARAICRILWPEHDDGPGPSLTASLHLNGERWDTETEGKTISWHKAGAESSPPETGRGRLTQRYRLALAELVKASDEDSEFAAVVCREMIGGVDLEKIRSAGKYRERPGGIRAQRHLVENARNALNRAMTAEESLQKSHLEILPETEEALKHAHEAEHLEGLYGKAIEYRKARADVDALDTQPKQLPLDRLDACHANDLETLEELDRKIEATLSELATRQRELASTVAAIGTLATDISAIPLAVIDRLRDLGDELGRHERDLTARHSELSRLRSDRDRLQIRLDGELSTQQVAALSGRISIPAAEDLARESHRLAGERAALKALRAELPTADTLADDDGSHAHETGRRQPLDWLTTAGLTICGLALASALALLHHPLWWIAVVPVILLYLRDHSRRGARQTHEQIRVDGQSRERRLQHQRLDNREQGLGERQALHDAQRQELEVTIGIPFPRDDAWLPPFASSVQRWQEAADKLALVENEITELEGKQTRLLDEAATLVRPYEMAPPTSANACTRAVERLGELDRNLQLRERVSTTIATALEPESERARQKRVAFFTARGLQLDDLSGLRKLHDQLLIRTGLDEQRQQARGAAQQAKGGLANEPTLLDLSSAELASRRNDAARAAATRNELGETIGKIKADIARARDGHELTDARHAHATHLDILQSLLADEGQRAAGMLVLEELHGRTQFSSEPEVFKRSRALFARFTTGRFVLQPPATATDQFTVHDSWVDSDKSVDELSTGERLQLLLAVRLGFLEHQEQYRLPLLLDETLGTSDDDRVGEIMDALIEIARDGRQIIYFTAQQDEASKWIARLEGDALPFQLIDLARIRDAGKQPVDFSAIERAKITAPPHPGDKSHTEYGRSLNVPGLNPLQQTADQLHIWYVVDDCEQLHTLLERKITTTGMYRNYARLITGNPASITTRTADRIQLGAQALALIFHDWQRGRARPVEMAQLLERGLISASFEDRVAALLIELGRDPQRLLDTLESGGLARWRKENTTRLRQAFEEMNVLGEGTRLGAAELTTRLAGHLNEGLRSGLFDRSWIDMIISLLPDLATDEG